MLGYRLNNQELAELRAAHRRTRHLREAYRINAVILLGKRRRAADLADALLHMNYVDSEALLNEVQLDDHLQGHLHLTADSGGGWVKQRWDLCYPPSGMAALLRRLGYVYKKPKLAPGRANAAAQAQFVKDLDDSRIELIFLPPYSPNLNLSERFWTFFKRQVLCNHY